MAEDEIRKHTKAAYHTLMDTEKNWKHKLREILVEVLIIVFAVTVSIWLHNWSERLKERKEEKNFLTELKKDLQADTTDIENSLQFYKFSEHGLNYFKKIATGDTLGKDSLHVYGNLFFSSTELEPHISRYEALKGSGKFDIIEDKDLLNNIIDLHESTLTRITMLNTYYLQYIQQVSSFIEEHAQLTKAGDISNAQDLLRTARMRILLGYGKSVIADNIIPAHEDGLKKCNALSRQIDKQLQ